jgi:hypothetical protein
MKIVLAAILLATPSLWASEKTLMHCFAWTVKSEATQADWDAFAKASDALPEKIKGIVRVWYGRLYAPLSQVSIAGMDNADFKKFQSGERVTSPVTRLWRQYGMCMEMKSADALKAYDADPYHQIWTDAYSKVRNEGTTTFNILSK